MAAKPKPAHSQKISPRESSGARRVPTQDRSRARLERILDAADTLFAESGYDGSTMEEIAQRAETSIGSVYQFFPNKRALFDALQTRYLERARELFESLAEQLDPASDWKQMLDGMIDAFWALHCDLPGFRAVWVHGSITAEMLAAGDVVNQAIAERVAILMGHFAPHVPPARRAIAAAVVVETTSALLFVAVRRAENEAVEFVAETKLVCRAYLERILDESPTR